MDEEGVSSSSSGESVLESDVSCEAIIVEDLTGGEELVHVPRSVLRN